jgi:hypothetical protein
VAELRLLGPAAVLVGTLATASAALASCPPCRTTPAPPGSPASGAPGPADGAGRAFVDALRRYSASPLIVTPLSGPAPHEIDIRWFTYPYPDVVRFDFDVDGDGTIDASVPMQGEHYPQQRHRFARPGDYTVTVYLRHATGGRSTTLQETVRVVAPDVLERELQARWSTLKDALRRRDLPAALECFTVGGRDRFESAFRVLFIDRATNVDDVLTSIRLVRHGRGYAIYEAVRTDGGLTKAFDVRFAIDADGVWRLDSL